MSIFILKDWLEPNIYACNNLQELEILLNEQLKKEKYSYTVYVVTEYTIIENRDNEELPF